MVGAGMPLGHTVFSWEPQGTTVPIGHTAFSWAGSAAQKAPGDFSEIEEQGFHGYEEGQRVRVRGLQKKPQFNDCVGTVDRLLDPFGGYNKSLRVLVSLFLSNRSDMSAPSYQVWAVSR